MHMRRSDRGTLFQLVSNRTNFDYKGKAVGMKDVVSKTED